MLVPVLMGWTRNFHTYMYEDSNDNRNIQISSNSMDTMHASRESGSLEIFQKGVMNKKTAAYRKLS